MSRILIIDDDEFIRDTLAERARRMRHQAGTAATLKEGMAALDAESYDLVFLDVRLPDGSGLDALSRIRQYPSRPDVIIITGAGNLGLALNSSGQVEVPFLNRKYRVSKKGVVRAGGGRLPRGMAGW